MTTATTVCFTPFDIELRRHRAAKALGLAVIARADITALSAVLAATPAETAEDRLDNLCAVWVRGALSSADVAAIEGQSSERITEFVNAYGSDYTSPRVWRHSWTRRHPRRNGERVRLSREEWLNENALCILRAGGVAVRPFGGQWIRVAADADYVSIALQAAKGNDTTGGVA